MKEQLKRALAVVVFLAAGRGGHHRGLVVGMSMGDAGADSSEGVCASVPTLAALAATSGKDGDSIRCDETQGTYRFKASATQSDGFVYVSPQGGAGAWVLEGDDLTLSAIDGQSDDWPRLMAALTATAAAGKRLVMTGDVTWICNTAPGQGALAGVMVPSFARLYCQPNVLIHSTLPASGNPGGFASTPFLTLAEGLGSGGPLAISAAQGATVLSVSVTSGALQAGDWIAIQSDLISNVAEIHQIVSVSGGASSYTVKIDEPLDVAWTAPDAYVTGVQVATHIDLDFNGAEISGTGDRAVELGAVQHSSVRNLRVTSRFGSFSWGGSFDIGGRYNTWQGCSSSGTSVVGFALENNHGSRIVDSVASNVVSSAGFYLPDDYACELRGGATQDNAIGVWLGAGGSNDPLGDVDTRVSGLRAIGNTSFGILVDNVTNLMISDTTVSGGGEGIIIAPALANTPHDVKLSNVSVHDTRTYGLVVENNATVEANGLSVDRAGGYSIYTTGTGTVVKLGQLGMSQAVAGYGPWYVDGGSALWVQDFTVNAQFDGSWFGVLTSPTSQLRLSNGTLAAGGSGTKCVLDMEAGGAVYLDQVSASGTGWSYGVFAAHGNGARVYRGRTVDLSVSANPFTFDSTAYANFGTVTVKGATPVTLGSPAPFASTGQTIVFSAQTLAGGPGAIISLPAQNGVTSVQSSAGDASTYTWYVVDSGQL